MRRVLLGARDKVVRLPGSNTYFALAQEQYYLTKKCQMLGRVIAADDTLFFCCFFEDGISFEMVEWKRRGLRSRYRHSGSARSSVNPFIVVPAGSR